MKDMQSSDSHELDLRNFVNNCRNLYKTALSSVKILLYSEMSNNFLPEVFLRITSEIENVTNLYNQITELQGKIYQHSSLQDGCSMLLYSYEIWLQRVTFQLDALLSSLKKIVHKLLELYTNDSLIAAIRLITFYNNLINTYSIIRKDTNHTSKSSIINQESRKKFTISRILKVPRPTLWEYFQIVAHDRTEECAHVLIQFLIIKYNDIDKINSLTSDLTDAEEDIMLKNGDEDIQHESDNTSILVYKTLTQYDSPPRNTSGSIHSKSVNKDRTQDIATETFITSERKRLDVLFSTIVDASPQELLTEQELAVSKRTGCIKVCSKVKQKLVEIYEQILWRNIGIVGEHMLLWWTDFGLGKKNQLVSQKFNAWLKQYFSTENLHITIQPTLYGLLDCLCCFITSTSWDELFTQSLISANNQHSRHDLQNIGLGTKTGHLFSDMLYDIVFLTNTCEGSNWTQQDLENLPLVEQIPLLHRLDHTIHSVRIWAMGRAKYLTNCWNMEQFFRVTHVDTNASLYALSQLKLTQNVSSLDHENSHFVVCSKMKAKLVSEVNVNIEKLHEVPLCSLKILASVCKITSLAYLKICFPPELYWQQQDECEPTTASDYVEKYLDEILKPVLLASQNLPLPVQKPVSKLILEILCEAWLDHIYNFRIKFSKWGAIQLLVDFGAIPVWIKEKITINNEIQSFLTSDEILRRCEGVGRLLLRHPGESIVMGSEQDIFQIENAKNKELESMHEASMPPEMYVPNQEKWLELRLDQQKLTILTITTCC